MKKRIITLLMAITLVSSMCMTSFGYDRLDAEAGKQNWRWEDWNDDGVYECYYYKDNGNRGFNLGVSPDGYELNEAGQWIIGGVVQTRIKDTSESTQSHSEVNTNIEYDPAHPLARKIDEWNLRLPYQYIGSFTISSNNVQAMLTGQMDQYYVSPVGYSTSDVGNQVYISQEAYDKAMAEEEALYSWYCNWLNGMDFESMSEMDRAKEIQKVLASASYDYDNVATGSADYNILIQKTGICGDFAMTATSLARALGLKTAVSGTGTHAVYYIQVNGVAYMGSNQVLELDYASPDFVYFQ